MELDKFLPPKFSEAMKDLSEFLLTSDYADEAGGISASRLSISRNGNAISSGLQGLTSLGKSDADY